MNNSNKAAVHDLSYTTNVSHRSMIKKENLRMFPYILILFGCFLSIVKTTFLGLDADEQYAITLAYRIARGDVMLKDVWEPHQTSALLPAFLIWIYKVVVPSLTFLVIYLRLCGAAIRAAISILWYRTFQKDFGRSSAFYTAAVFFLTLPKWIVSPEFCNQQLWYWVVACLFLYRYFKNNKTINVIIAGIFLSFAILCYPSCLILFIPYFILLYKHSKKSAFIFFMTCFALGSLFLIGLLLQMSPKEMIFYISMVLHDPSHQSSIFSKLTSYMTVLVNAMPRIIICLLIGFIISKVIPFFKHMQSLKGFAFSALTAASIDQFGLWLFGMMPNVHPQIHYLFLFLFGIVFYNSCRKRKCKAENKSCQVLFSVFWLPAPIGFLAVLSLTNLDILGSLVHLLPGMLASILFILCDGGSVPENEVSIDLVSSFSKPFVFLWVCLLIFADIFLLRIEWNRPANVFLTRQKALSGPVKNIYCPYMVGYEYNEESNLLTQTLPPDTGIFFVGIHFPMTYMMNSYRVCTASTISTPVYDERYLEYFEMHPDKLPEYAVIEKKFWNEEMPADNPVRKWLLDQFNWSDCKENEFIYIIPFSPNN